MKPVGHAQVVKPRPLRVAGADALRHALTVYLDCTEHGRHCQSREFHRIVANDAAHVLALACNLPAPATPPTEHMRSSVEDALAEVRAELAILCATPGSTARTAHCKARAMLNEKKNGRC